MMVYELYEGKLILIEDDEIIIDNSKKYIGLIENENALGICEKFGITIQMAEKAIAVKTARFESHDNLDIICTPLIDFSSSVHPYDIVHFFVRMNSVLIVCSKISNVSSVMDRFLDKDVKNINISRLLFEFFEFFIEKKQIHLDNIELTIINFEDEILLRKQNKNYIQNLALLRKQLLLLKRYYEQLVDILSDIDENENGIFDEHVLKFFRIIAGKVDRLYHSVLSLRDYVTQIREAYQAEVDISLNQTMKVFTVITAIFFPLTLIVGWYGMNFNMPEYHSYLGYPFVIVACAMVIVFSLYYFKKHKWFL